MGAFFTEADMAALGGSWSWLAGVAGQAIEQTSQVLFHVDLRLLQHQLQATAQKLTPRQRQIFAMRYPDGLLPSEIAHALAISPARVTQALTETVAKLQRTFARA